ncbi:phosphate acyltransferase PlsX [Aliikangiella sp. G2MR2-5]|uniref:phosphate acyltransferase PlsX n=1 Tax=Aliikangiella sp. G2MR2-5 TaxID=2788943 RepID=UPI0018A97E85|nr:phosphate acyltransferase PlsX [Aliikangiella sp. G2MR2-5]
MTDVILAIDCMGGDYGPPVTIPAVKKALTKYPNVTFRLFGDIQKIEFHLKQNRIDNHPQVRVHGSEDDVLMTDSPALALKNKKQSSMRLALESLRDGRATACVSAGNTGALMAISRFVLKMLPGIDRPAIISAIPTLQDSHVYLLDLGANVECDEKRLLQFAIMGSELAKCDNLRPDPVVGLLNVGAEEIKGSPILKKASDMMASFDSLNYQGFVEGNQIFSGNYQVVVTDGFTGNNVLKASEGLSHYLTYKIRKAFERNWWTRFLGILSKPILAAFKSEVNPEKYNGACLIGLRGIVIKSHGSANINATFCAFEEAILQSNQKLTHKIRQELEKAAEKMAQVN